MKNKRSALLWFGLAVLAAACTVKAVGDPEKPITIKAHIVIDIRELKDTAVGIEDTIAQQAKNAPIAAAQPTQLSLLSVARRWMEPETAYAEGGYDLKEITPEIKTALDGRAARFSRLAVLKQSGKAGEDNEGHVKNLSGDPETAGIVADENRDREVIYRAIVAQNNFPSNVIYTVRSVFAEVQHKKARTGEKIQLASGEWVTKA